MKEFISEKLARITSGWYVWIFPLFALLISGGLFLNYLNERGEMIRIRFEDGAGVQAEKTHLRFRGVSIGEVKKIELSSDTKEVIVHARLRKDAFQFSREGAKFWVVLPKVSIQGVSGLETLFEGPYIAAQPGNPQGATKLEFKGRLDSEPRQTTVETASYFLETDNVQAINVGDSVFFRGFKVGSVTKVFLSKAAQFVIIQINVERRYVKLIRTNTVFWRNQGIEASLGLFKSEVKISSLETLLHGGINFFTPDSAGKVAKTQSYFFLNSTPPKDWEKWNPELELY